MNKIEITEINPSKYIVWFNGENVVLKSKENIDISITFLNNVVKYLISKRDETNTP